MNTNLSRMDAERQLQEGGGLWLWMLFHLLAGWCWVVSKFSPTERAAASRRLRWSDESGESVKRPWNSSVCGRPKGPLGNGVTLDRASPAGADTVSVGESDLRGATNLPGYSGLFPGGAAGRRPQQKAHLPNRSLACATDVTGQTVNVRVPGSEHRKSATQPMGMGKGRSVRDERGWTTPEVVVTVGLAVVLLLILLACRKHPAARNAVEKVPAVASAGPTNEVSSGIDMELIAVAAITNSANKGEWYSIEYSTNEAPSIMYVHHFVAGESLDQFISRQPEGTFKENLKLVQSAHERGERGDQVFQSAVLVGMDDLSPDYVSATNGIHRKL